MKRILPALIVALLTAAGSTGCAFDAQSTPDRMTQQIVGSSAPSVSGAAQDSALPQTEPDFTGKAQTGAASSLLEEADFNALYQVKAEKKAIEIEKENLEAGYRVGKYTEEEFKQRKDALKEQKNALEDEEHRLKELFGGSRYLETESFAGENMDSLLQKSLETKQREDALELEEDRLEARYRQGEITRETYIEKQAEVEKEDDLLDIREDALEDALELLGWDD